MLPGETIATGAASTCADCLKDLKNEVLRSAAGYYIGTLCDCGPYTRESGYYRTEEEAQRALDADTFVRF
jgi:non-ribosomal peptide synthetase component E (peptide arylation enzyme)